MIQPIETIYLPASLPPARPPKVVARFEATPQPEELLALGARVEETPLHVGKWRGTGAKTVRYVLELPEDRAIEYRGRLLSQLVLKVPPSGKAKVEDTARHEGAAYARGHQASRYLWSLDPGLTREVDEVAPQFFPEKRDPLRQIRAFNTLLLTAFRIKHCADLTAIVLKIEPETPVTYTSSWWGAFEPHLDPGRTWEGTLERLRRGEARSKTPLDERHTLFEGGRLRFSFTRNHADLDPGQGPSFAPARTRILDEGVLEGRPPARDHADARDPNAAIDADKLFAAVQAAREAYRHGSLDRLVDGISPYLEARERDRLDFVLEIRDPELRRRDAWRLAFEFAAGRLLNAEALRNALSLVPKAHAPRGLASEAARDAAGFQALAGVLGVPAGLLAALIRIVYDRPTGPRGYDG